MNCDEVVTILPFKENFGCPSFEGNFIFSKKPIGH